MSDGMFGAIKISASGMRGQRTKMDVVARNLANAETTRTADGTPYRRQRAIFEQVLGDKVRRHAEVLGRPVENRLLRTHPGHLPASGPGRTGTAGGGLTSEVAVAPDASEFRVVYDPGHPDADEQGYVLMPNVNPITEMVDMITASRAYEANVSAVQTAKDMFNDALKI
jgi:flagellar basal-body rod protein FlgC